MKTLLVVFLTTLSFLGISQERQVVTPLPFSLPIGSRQTMLEYASTNFVCHIDVVLLYNDTNGSLANVYRAGDGLRFNSYTNFQQCLLTNGWWVYTNYHNMLITNCASTSTISLYYDITYDLAGGSPIGIQQTTNIGYLTNLTRNSFSNHYPKVWSVVPVDNLYEFDVAVNNSTNYTYTWMSGSPPTARERTTSGLLVLNEWYSVAGYRARFTVKNFGNSADYTQHGAQIAPGMMSMSNNVVSVSMPKGADCELQSSTNFIDWTSLTSTSGWSGLNKVSFTVNKQATRNFFRAKLY